MFAEEFIFYFVVTRHDGSIAEDSYDINSLWADMISTERNPVD